MIGVGPYFTIPEWELEFTFVRSSGPGGQNVNKVNSKCQLRWNVVSSASIPAYLRDRVLGKLQSKLTLAGDLVVASDVYRDQPRNKEDCQKKLQEIVLAACRVEKARKATKPTRSSQRKRESSKRLNAAKKGMRGRVRGE